MSDRKSRFVLYRAHGICSDFYYINTDSECFSARPFPYKLIPDLNLPTEPLYACCSDEAMAEPKTAAAKMNACGFSLIDWAWFSNASIDNEQDIKRM